jgi:thiol-disulfide isomerase/thioredoxin
MLLCSAFGAASAIVRNKRFLWPLVLITALASCDHQNTSPDARVSSKFSIVTIQPSSTSLAMKLQQEAARARNLGRSPYLELYAPWCGPCLAIEKALADSRMRHAFRNTYIIKLNIDEWDTGELEQLGFRSNYIPKFYRLLNSGEKQGDFIDAGAWNQNVASEMSPKLEAFFQVSSPQPQKHP